MLIPLRGGWRKFDRGRGNSKRAKARTQVYLSKCLGARQASEHALDMYYFLHSSSPRQEIIANMECALSAMKYSISA